MAESAPTRSHSRRLRRPGCGVRGRPLAATSPGARFDLPLLLALDEVGNLDEDDELCAENARPFELPLDPEVDANALSWAADADEARNPAIDPSGPRLGLLHE